jgi:hypothetical protein
MNGYAEGYKTELINLPKNIMPRRMPISCWHLYLLDPRKGYVKIYRKEYAKRQKI